MVARRTLLGIGAALAAASAIPTGFAVARCVAHARECPLTRALARACELGKPVLVFVAPETGEDDVEIAHALAEAFERGGHDLHVDLALVEVACATRSQIRAADVLGYQQLDRVGLIERAGEGWRWRAIAFDLTPYWSTWRSFEDYVARAKLNALALRTAIAPDAAAIERLDRAARAALPPELVAKIERSFETGIVPLAGELDRAAALVRASEHGGPWSARLAQAAHQRIWRESPHGGRWVEADCGSTTVHFLAADDDAERADLFGRATGEPPSPMLARVRELVGLQVRTAGVLCGMALSTRASERFLVFYTDEA